MAENASEKQIQSGWSAPLRPSILIIPSLVKGRGTGHLQRSLYLAEGLGRRAAILAARGPVDDIFSIECMIEGREDKGKINIVYEIEDVYDFIIVDKPRLTKKEAERYNKIAVTIAIDPGGPGRESCAYVIDCLPGPASLSPGNISDIGFLPLPRNVRSAPPKSFRNILISFGGEDKAGLTSCLVKALIDNRICAPETLSVIVGPAFSRQDLPGGITVHKRIHNLKEELYKYDLVFTHFGLTAFESVSAAVPVILFNPSRYHRKLSRKYRFPEIGVKRLNKKKLSNYLGNPCETAEICNKIGDFENKDLAQYISGLAVPHRFCPACGSCDYRIVERFDGQSYCRCTNCRSFFLMNFRAQTIKYDNDYFFSEYRSQYGKTYVEDFDHIKSLGHKRLEYIRSIGHKKLNNTTAPLLLDVGCAYGPFLKAASLEGFAVCGIDVSPGAIEYVNKKLGFEAAVSTFELFEAEKEFGVSNFDVITFWFVIEHFKDLRPIFKKTSELLVEGGVLAVSTPNGAGISAKKDPCVFFEESPADHYTIFTPGSIRRLLKQHGFRIKKIRNTGHHTERFSRHVLFKIRFIERITLIISKLFRLGDTFEIYAEKRV